MVFLVLLALAFDFMNGFHDAANAIHDRRFDTGPQPHTAVMMAAFFNVVAIFVFQLKVAATVGKGHDRSIGHRSLRRVWCAGRCHRLERHHRYYGIPRRRRMH